MSITTDIFWMLCAFASVALAAAPAREPYLGVVLILSGLVAGAWWQTAYSASLQSVGPLIAVAAASALWSSRAAIPMMVVGGAAGALWGSALHRAGVPLTMAAIIGAAPALIGAYFAATRSGFAPPVVRDEALLIVLALALGATVAPGIVDGWRSAQLLNADAVAGASLPRWIVALMAGLVGSGGLYTLWKRA